MDFVCLNLGRFDLKSPFLDEQTQRRTSPLAFGGLVIVSVVFKLASGGVCRACASGRLLKVRLNDAPSVGLSGDQTVASFIAHCQDDIARPDAV